MACCRNDPPMPACRWRTIFCESASTFRDHALGSDREPAARAGNKPGEIMSLEANRSSHPLLSCTDGIAAGMSDTLLLLARLLIAGLFLLTAGFGSPNVGYLTSLGYPNPDFMSVLAITAEFIIVISLILERRDAIRRLARAAVRHHRDRHGAPLLDFPAAAAGHSIYFPHQESRRRRRLAAAVRDRRRPLQRRPGAVGAKLKSDAEWRVAK